MKKSPVLLIILEDLGVNPSRAHNAWALVEASQTWRQPF